MPSVAQSGAFRCGICSEKRQLRVIQHRARTEEPLCCAFPPGSSAPTSPSGMGRGWERWNQGNVGRDESNAPGGGEAEQEEDPARCSAPAGSCSAISRSSSRVVLCGEDKRHRSERAPPAFPPLFHCRAHPRCVPPAGSSREGSGARIWGATNVIPILNPRTAPGQLLGRKLTLSKPEAGCRSSGL